MKIFFFLSFMLISFQIQAQEETKNYHDIKKELDSINISGLENPCDCPDAMEKAIDIFLRETQPFSSREELKNDALALQIISLTNLKIQELANTCEKMDTSDAALINCGNYKTLEEKMQRLKARFGE